MKNKKKKFERKSIPMITRAASFEPKSFNEEKRTVDVVFSTGAQVRRFDFWERGEFMEELSLKRGHVDLSRLKNGAPVLNNHNARSLEDQIGVVESATVQDGVGTATLRFSERESVEPIVADIKSGVIRNISVGYSVQKFEDGGETEDGVPILRAVKWTPIEISAVNAGADPGAQIRNETSGADFTMTDCDFPISTRNEDPSEDDKELAGSEPKEPIDSEGEQMTEDEKKVAEEKRQAELKTVRTQAIKDEQKRQADIRTVATQCNLDEAFVTEMVEGDFTADNVRKSALEKMHEAQKETNTRSENATVQVTKDEHDTRRSGIQSALLHRGNPSTYKEVSEEGRKYMQLSLSDMARECLEAKGVSTRMMSKMEIAKRALHTSSDFPELLANTAGRTLRDAYEAAPQTFAAITRRTSISDFKQVSRTQLGDAPDLEEVGEKGEIQRGSISEAAEKYSLKTYAKIVCFSRQMLVNDDLSAFTRMPELMGRAARDLESDLVWVDIINANPLMADAVALFAAGHSNLDSGGAGSPTDTLLGAIRASMRSQVGLNGRLLNITPVWFHVPPELETVAEKLISSISPNAQGDVNPFSPSGRSPLQLVVEPRLSGGTGGSATAWYVSASQRQIDVIEMGTLNGAGPVMESREGFDVEGMELKIRHDVAAKALDHRGIEKNAG